MKIEIITNCCVVVCAQVPQRLIRLNSQNFNTLFLERRCGFGVMIALFALLFIGAASAAFYDEYSAILVWGGPAAQSSYYANNVTVATSPIPNTKQITVSIALKPSSLFSESPRDETKKSKNSMFAIDFYELNGLVFVFDRRFLGRTWKRVRWRADAGTKQLPIQRRLQLGLAAGVDFRRIFRFA